MVSNDSRHFVDMMVVVREGSPKPQILQLLAGQVHKKKKGKNIDLTEPKSANKVFREEEGESEKKGRGRG
jgi:hypothetical protein